MAQASELALPGRAGIARRRERSRLGLPFALTLSHVFNHGTHHRAQITAAVTAMGHVCPELDLVWMLQAENAQP